MLRGTCGENTIAPTRSFFLSFNLSDLRFWLRPLPPLWGDPDQYSSRPPDRCYGANAETQGLISGCWRPRRKRNCAEIESNFRKVYKTICGCPREDRMKPICNCSKVSVKKQLILFDQFYRANLAILIIYSYKIFKRGMLVMVLDAIFYKLNRATIIFI